MNRITDFTSYVTAINAISSDQTIDFRHLLETLIGGF
jgi:hypothetical protein